MDSKPATHDALPLAVLGLVSRAHRLEIDRAHSRFDRIFNDAPNGIALLDDRGTIVEANQALADLLGREVAALTGASLDSLSGDRREKVVAEHCREVMHGLDGRASTYWTARHSAGHLVHLALTSTTIRAVDGQGDLVLTTALDVTDQLLHERLISQLAHHDALTGLVNRERFMNELQLHLVGHESPQGALLLLDLDRFKEVNDSLGHTIGDQLIIQVASIVREKLRPSDLVARLGGDEFAILLPDADTLSAEVVAQDVLERIRAHAQTMEGAHRRITASIGVVQVTEQHTSADLLLAEAEMTMYDAKESGGAQYAVANAVGLGQPRTRARIEWTDRLQRALVDDELVLHLQPIQEVETGRIIGAEALLRLVDGDTLVAPNCFLDIAERSDLIVQVDEWVVGRSLELLGAIQKTWPDFRLEVNLSGRSIGATRLEEALRQQIVRHGVDPTGLVLEITETAAVADIKAARAFAQRLRALGCRFALDDFGAGFGSFYYLKHLLFDYVKIDGEFVEHCHTNPTDRAILRSIVGIARGLGKRTIAEHVSGPEILDTVRAEGVDFAQGYYVGRPVPVDQFMSQVGS